jgi:ABC-type uncharacterized transport system auxiliary subunit
VPGGTPALFADVLAAILLLMMLSGAAGCALTQPYPQKNQYVISAGDPAAAGGSRSSSVLRIRSARVAKPYDEKTFVYKTGESAFTVDYYNGFLADPSPLLTGELTRWLAASGHFAVVLGSTGADNDLTLETNVTALYGDYSEKGSPKAVIEARFILVREDKTAYRVVFEKTYRQVEPLAGAQPEQLVKGFGQAYRRMLESLTVDLQAVVAPGYRPAA